MDIFSNRMWNPSRMAVPLRGASATFSLPKFSPPPPKRPVIESIPSSILGVSEAALGQRGTVAALGLIPLVLGGALGAGTAWVGFKTGEREEGLLSLTGYVVGTIGALAALASVLGGIFWVAAISGMPETTAPRDRYIAPSPSREVTMPDIMTEEIPSF